MKRAAMVIAVLGAVLGGVPGSLRQGNDQAGNAECAGRAGARSRSATCGTSGAPAGKRPPKVNSQEEFAAYKAAAALTDAAALEKAADDFAAKYPDSELRTSAVPLGDAALSIGQQRRQDDGDGEEVLAIDPDDPKRWWARRRCWRNARVTPIWIATSASPKPKRCGAVPGDR